MAKYSLTQGDISDISGLSEVSVSKKFQNGYEFKITPACRILLYFKEHGETKLTFEELFCVHIILEKDLLCVSGD